MDGMDGMDEMETMDDMAAADSLGEAWGWLRLFD